MAEEMKVNGRYQELHDELCSLLLESAGQGRLDRICMMATHQPEILQTKGNFGVTIAHVAAFYGQWHILEFLSKTDPKFLFEEANDGGTPAHHAAAAGRTETLKYLASQSLSHMVARDLDGWTPAHVASYYGRAETLILMAKVSPSVLGIATNAGRTPKDLCQSAECRQLIECLEKIVSDAGSGSPLRGQVARDKADLSQLMSVLSVSPLSKATQKTNQHNVCGNQAGATHGDGNHAEQRFPGDGGGHRKRLTMSVSGGVGQECVQAGNTSSTLSENRGASALAGGRNGEFGKEGAAGGRGEELDGEERVTWTQDVTTMEQEAQWKLLLRDLRKGADLTNMVIPAQFIRPQSVLERLAFLMQHGKYLEGISSASSPLARLKAVVSFHMSGLVREVFDGKKPYNPILGETCAWAFRHPESGKGVTRMVCEQVSHHPPISAMHIHNETLGISVEGAALIEAKFTGNTVLVPFKGTRKLRIHGLDEEYLLTVPSLQYRGVMLGPKGAEWIGKVEVSCARTKLVAKLDMKSVGWLGMWGAWHRVEGAITSKTAKKEILGTISGCWDKKLVFKCAQTSKTDTLYDYEWAAAHARLQMVDVVGATLGSNSNKVWGKTSAALRAKDYKTAGKEKKAVEVAQRQLRAARDKGAEQAFNPLFFKQVGGEWVANPGAIFHFHQKCMHVPASAEHRDHSN